MRTTHADPTHQVHDSIFYLVANVARARSALPATTGRD